ncbi:MAG: hypothetical protein Q8O74_01680, partial [bacterium]|nr:hypothetical protein [bacterium]
KTIRDNDIHHITCPKSKTNVNIDEILGNTERTIGVDNNIEKKSEKTVITIEKAFIDFGAKNDSIQNIFTSSDEESLKIIKLIIEKLSETEERKDQLLKALDTIKKSTDRNKLTKAATLLEHFLINLPVGIASSIIGNILTPTVSPYLTNIMPWLYNWFSLIGKKL